jgi:hypothetical protein
LSLKALQRSNPKANSKAKGIPERQSRQLSRWRQNPDTNSIGSQKPGKSGKIDLVDKPFDWLQVSFGRTGQVDFMRQIASESPMTRSQLKRCWRDFC